MRNKYLQLKEWYERHESRIGTGSLVTGFIFDSLTLSRIDALRDNLWITINLVVVGFCIYLLNHKKQPDPKEHFWLFTILQFGFGTMLGAFFIFYFQSATISVSWPFLLILILLMISNELFQRKYARLVLQLSFFYLSIYFFSIFMVPILINKIGAGTFMLSGLLSLAIIWLYMRLLKQFLWRPVLVIFVFVNILYFTNLIPPIPLSLKDAGIYHGVVKNTSGEYLVIDEKRGWFEKFFKWHERVHWVRGETLYALSSVYSPADFNISIFHEWQYFYEAKDDWVTATRIPLKLTGGRVEGFRTFSTKTSLMPGLWRVNVETSNGQLIGRTSFRIVESLSAPALVTYKK